MVKSSKKNSLSNKDKNKLQKHSKQKKLQKLDAINRYNNLMIALIIYPKKNEHSKNKATHLEKIMIN